MADQRSSVQGWERFDWTEKVSVLASLLPDDLSSTDNLSLEQQQRVVDIVQIIKAQFDPPSSDEKDQNNAS